MAKRVVENRKCVFSKEMENTCVSARFTSEVIELTVDQISREGGFCVLCVCVCVWEFGTGEQAASQADGACPIPYSAGSLVHCCTVCQTSTAETGILDGLALNFVPARSSPCALASCTDHSQKDYLYFKQIYNNFPRLTRLICSIRLTLPNYSPRHYFTQAHHN